MIEIQVNGDPVRLSPCSVFELLESRGLADRRVAVERNGQIVPRSQHAHTRIEPGDVVEIVVAVGGG